MPDYRLSARPTPIPPNVVIGTCVMCNKLIGASDLPEDEYLKKYVLKWKVHPKCYELINNKLDQEAN